MRRLPFAPLLPLAFAILTGAVLAQAPPTRVERARRSDPQTGDLPPTASWRGTAIETRPYAETPELQRIAEEPDPPAGAYRRVLPPAELRTDGDLISLAQGDDPADFDPPAAAADRVADPADADAYLEEVRYTYGASGEITRVDRYRAGEDAPASSLGYSYTMAGTVIEEEILPDGSRRFVREMDLDVFQASQGAGNQPYRDNRDATQAYPVENAARPTPANPRLGSGTDVSPQR